VTLVEHYAKPPADFRPKRGNGWGSVALDARVVKYCLVGRTIPLMKTLAPLEEIDALADEIGFEIPWGWGEMTREQRLDVLATRMIETSRVGKAQTSEFVLSPHQWYERTRHEIPMTQEQMHALVTHNSHLAYYRGPVEDKSSPGHLATRIQHRAERDALAKKISRKA
jgi:hypothetical protein